jgi:hypothetical protein
MRLADGTKDWSRPVWLEQAKMDRVFVRLSQEQTVEAEAEMSHALYCIASRGFDSLIAAARKPNALAWAADDKRLAKRPDLVAHVNGRREDRGDDAAVPVAGGKRSGAIRRFAARRPSFAHTEAGRQLTMSMQALKRVATPDDIGGVFAFLASDAARWITGHTIAVDGGSKL